MSSRTIESQRSSDSSWLPLDNRHENCYDYYHAINGGEVAWIDDVTSSQGYVYQRDTAERYHTDSLEFGQLVTDGSASRQLVCPPHLICFLSVTVNESVNCHHVLSTNKSMYVRPLRTRWQEGSTYVTLNSIAEHRVRSKVLGPRRYFLRGGYARLLEWSHNCFVEIDYHEVKFEAHWSTYITQMIARYCNQGAERLPFYLELNRDFEWFTVESIPRQMYSKAVGNALVRTALKNFEKKNYWSKSLMKRIFDVPTIQRIVDEDCKIKATAWKRPLSDQEKDKFVQWLVDDRWRLLAVFIRGNLDLSSLHKLMLINEPITGSELPLSDDILNSFLMPIDAETFRDKQAGFRPINFAQHGKPMHMTVRSEELVPIHFDLSDLVSEDGLGNVYRASINSDHHNFSRNKSEKFALKVLRSSAISQARREIPVWEDIVTQPHPHMLWFHAFWSQEDRFYMLYPLPEDSLSKQLMDNDSRFDPVKDLEWLLEQLEGLVSGIHHIHNIARKKIGRQTLRLDQKTDYGYHHNLKPDNILIYQRRRSPRKKWVISDFGTVKLQQVVSHLPGAATLGGAQLVPGDPLYGGPEPFAGIKAGKPYDIWSLGCILLEIILWAFGHGGSDLSRFHKERLNEMPPVKCCDCKTNPTQTDCGSVTTSIGNSERMRTGHFWYICRRQAHHLRPSVVAKLAFVKDEALKQCPTLIPLCELISRMLSINPEERPIALAILEEIESMRWQAKKVSSLGTVSEGVSQKVSIIQIRQSPAGSSIRPRLNHLLDQMQSPGAAPQTSLSSSHPITHDQSSPDPNDVISLSTNDQHLLNPTKSLGAAMEAEKPIKDQIPSSTTSRKSSKRASLLRKVFSKKKRQD